MIHVCGMSTTKDKEAPLYHAVILKKVSSAVLQLAEELFLIIQVFKFICEGIISTWLVSTLENDILS